MCISTRQLFLQESLYNLLPKMLLRNCYPEVNFINTNLPENKIRMIKSIVYKKTDKWHIERQRVTTNDNEWYSEWQRMATGGNEWQRITTSGTTNDDEWYNEWKRVTTNQKEWQQMRKSENKWQWVTAWDSKWYSEWKQHNTLQRTDDCHPFYDKNRYTTSRDR